MKTQFFKDVIQTATGLVLVGSAIQAMAAGPLAYVPLGTANEVAVIDTASYKVVAQPGGVVNSHGAALTPDGRFLVVGSLTGRPAGQPPAKPEGISAEEHAAHHGGAMPSKSNMLGTLYLIDTTTEKVVRTFDVPGPVHHVLVTADGRYAVSTHPMGGGISVVALDSGEMIASLATGPAPNYMVENPETHAIFVSNSGNGTISEVGTEHWYVRRNIRVGGSPEHMILSARKNRLYANDVSGGRALVVDADSGKLIAAFPVGPEPHGIGLSADGAILYATSKEGNRVVAIDLSDGRIRSAELGPAPYHLAVNPADGRLLVTSRDEHQLWVVDPQTLEPVDTIPIAGIGHQVALEKRSRD